MENEEYEKAFNEMSKTVEERKQIMLDRIAIIAGVIGLILGIELLITLFTI